MASRTASLAMTPQSEGQRMPAAVLLPFPTAYPLCWKIGVGTNERLYPLSDLVE
jgi:hypothetical protein